ncbi:MAG: histidine kinase [Flavisolibacter sp.]|nr:histidine kinase [Flavisolibacter sp.]MBD0285567.1 histidine kinase [Flavisolibacter sp.]MBD0295614.1 histidine kinase [Flavisolibacter sp.]MBD0350734.1 histidine kinase [Flavisolibacter sp.]MBD0376017.1 histidine kinase [Flavisolibacter sp.]
MNAQWYTKKWVIVSLHVLFWALFFLSPYLLRPVMESDATKGPHRGSSGFYSLLFFNNVARLILFYANAYLFIPRLVYKRKYLHYLLILVAALFSMLLLDRFLFNLFIEGRKHNVWNFFVFNIFPFFFIVISSTAFRMIHDRIEESQKAKEKETETLKTELSFLRSQVSPHFMFNVLNNMVALARKKSDALEPSLIKLSSLLRYMLYETDEDKVLLEKEVDYLQSYIDLQQQRFGKNVKINTCFKHIENGYTIEPMLLIPFVENAFKHGTGLITDAQIDIKLSVQDGILQFSVRNRYTDSVTETKDKTSGIGLNNVKRRLNLLYDKRHSLQIDKKDGWFTVSLQLNLH